MFHLVAQVAADDVEQWAAFDVGGANQLADIPAAAGLVGHLFFAEGVGLVGEVPAEDDGVRPDVADDVRQRIGQQRPHERALHAGQHPVQERGDRTGPLVTRDAAQAPTDPGPAGLLDPASQGQLGEAERAGADERPSDVVLDDLLAGLAPDGLEVVFEVRHRLVSAEQRLDVGVVHGDAPLEQHHEQEVVERLAEVPGPPLLVRVDAHDLVAEILVLAADVGERVVDVVVGVLPRFGARRGVPVPHRGMDVGIVHPVPLSMQDVVAELHVLQDLGHAQAGRAEQPRGRRT